MADDDDDDPVELNISIDKIRDIVLLVREYDMTEFPDEPDPERKPTKIRIVRLCSTKATIRPKSNCAK